MSGPATGMMGGGHRMCERDETCERSTTRARVVVSRGPKKNRDRREASRGAGGESAMKWSEPERPAQVPVCRCLRKRDNLYRRRLQRSKKIVRTGA